MKESKAAESLNDIEEQIGEEEEQESTSDKANLKKRIIIAAIGLTILLLIAGGFFLFNYLTNSDSNRVADIGQLKEAQEQIVFHDMDDIIVNLNTQGAGNKLLRVQLTLELHSGENLKIVKDLMPKIRDIFQIYLRSLRPNDLHGAIGLYKMREELLLRVNKILYPAKIKDILFKEIITQ